MALVDRLEELLATDQLEEASVELRGASATARGPHKENLIILSAQLKRLAQQRLAGRITREQYEADRNELIFRALQIGKALEGDAERHNAAHSVSAVTVRREEVDAEIRTGSSQPQSRNDGIKKAEHHAIDDVVVLLHGIRTQAFWQGPVSAMIKRELGFEVTPIKYGYFDIFRFVFPVGTRERPVRRVIRELSDIFAKYPGARVSLISHSFGTYIFSRALREPRIKFHRVILCGSIIPEDFRVAEFEGKLGGDKIRNDCGTKDIYPVLAKSVTWGYGATGTFGFGTVGIEDRLHECGHSDYFKDDFVRESWLSFLRDGDKALEPPSKVAPTPYWLSILAWLPLRYVIWGGLLVAIAWLIAASAIGRRNGAVGLPDAPFGPFALDGGTISCNDDRGPEIKRRQSYTAPSGRYFREGSIQVQELAGSGKSHSCTISVTRRMLDPKSGAQVIVGFEVFAHADCGSGVVNNSFGKTASIKCEVSARIVD